MAGDRSIAHQAHHSGDLSEMAHGRIGLLNVSANEVSGLLQDWPGAMVKRHFVGSFYR